MNHGCGEEKGPAAPARVWIVDDSRTEARRAAAALVGCDVTVFHDGLTMLEQLGSSAPDLVLLDWYMPEVSGLEVCCHIREISDPAQLPILVLTAATDREALRQALDAGANDFVRKPFYDGELAARVAALLRTHRLHARLLETEAQLRVEAVYRERFIGMLAHDLRQPLATLVAANATLGRTEHGDARTKMLGMQARAAERMRRMIAELLDFTRSRPTSGIHIQRRLVNLREIAETALEETRVNHPKQDVTLTTDGECDGFWDPDRLAQVCSNLIGNALEHSPEASPVRIGLVCRDGHVELRIANEGPPIPPAMLPLLFEPFRRGQQTGRTDGLGLGLYIVHEIVRAHGGSISVESDHASTRFLVRLPRGSAASAD